MKTFKSALFLFSSFIAIAPLVAGAAGTIPEGTTLTIKTAGSISSRDSAGRPFKGRLAQDIQVKGKVLLAAGADVTGVVESPRVVVASSTRPLTLKLTQIAVNGRMMPIKTEGLETEAAGVKTQRGKRVTGGAFVLSTGTTLQFRLSQPLNM